MMEGQQESTARCTKCGKDMEQGLVFGWARTESYGAKIAWLPGNIVPGSGGLRDWMYGEPLDSTEQGKRLQWSPMYPARRCDACGYVEFAFKRQEQASS